MTRLLAAVPAAAVATTGAVGVAIATGRIGIAAPGPTEIRRQGHTAAILRGALPVPPGQRGQHQTGEHRKGGPAHGYTRPSDSRRLITPATISAMPSSFITPAPSPKTRMPMAAIAMVPTADHTA